MIGVAITTHNRGKVALETFAKWKAMLPEKALLIVVDDASDEPFPNADYRFSSNVGIARAKNKCIELLIEKGCTELFLSDDDTYPTSPNWWKPYIDSPYPLLSYTFSSVGRGIQNGNRLIKRESAHKWYSNPCGCMVYVSKIVIDRIGGYDIQYALYGDEHLDFAIRAKNAGLLPHSYIDVAEPLFYCHDQSGNYRTSRTDKQAQLYLSRRRLLQQKGSKAFFPFKESTQKIQKPYILSSYLNYEKDPQRNVILPNSIEALRPLMNSCNDLGIRLVILTNCKFENEGTTEFVTIDNPDPKFTPVDFRWLIQLEYIQKNPTTIVWCVDGTDVEVLKNPFTINPTKLYVGYEKGQTLANGWLWRHLLPFCKNRNHKSWFAASKHLTLLNCGVVGGGYSIALKFYQMMANDIVSNAVNVKGRPMDMASLNYVVYNHFAKDFISGEQVVTEFKAYERNDISVFKHK